MQSGFCERTNEDESLDEGTRRDVSEKSEHPAINPAPADLEGGRKALVIRVAELQNRLEAAQRNALTAIATNSLLRQLTSFVTEQVSQTIFGTKPVSKLPSPLVESLISGKLSL